MTIAHNFKDILQNRADRDGDFRKAQAREVQTSLKNVEVQDMKRLLPDDILSKDGTRQP